jgi:hypothetical protein
MRGSHDHAYGDPLLQGGGMLALYLMDPKNLLTFQMRCEGRARGVFCDGNCHFQCVTKLANLSQLQFISIRILSMFPIIQVFPIQGTLFENMNIVIISHSIKTSTFFSKLLYPNVINYF